MDKIVNREIHLKNRPVGLPRESDFGLVEVPIPEIGAGQMLICNIYMSVDPYLRGRMADRKSQETLSKRDRCLFRERGRQTPRGGTCTYELI